MFFNTNQSLNRTFYGIETELKRGTKPKPPVLIVPFMELKQDQYVWDNKDRNVLIVPFMELKPQNSQPKTTSLGVLIVPFMELKLLIGTKQKSFLWS